MDNCGQLKFVDNPEHPAMKRSLLSSASAVAVAILLLSPAAAPADEPLVSVRTSGRDPDAGRSAPDAAAEIAATFGARFDFACRVLSEDGSPLAGASVGWIVRSDRWRAGDRNSADVRLEPSAETGADGVARLAGVATGASGLVRLPGPAFGPVSTPALLVSAAGRYDAAVPLSLSAPSGGVWRVAPAGAEPGAPVEARLRAVGERVPMIVSALPQGTRLHGDPVGFDAEAGELLPPFGNGRTADFFVRAAATPAFRSGLARFWIEFSPAPGGALLAAPSVPDALRTPREAPADGWSEGPVRFREGAEAVASTVLFRSPRAREGRFGAIVPPLSPHASVPQMVWTVLFAVEPGRRGLEPDPVDPAKPAPEPAEPPETPARERPASASAALPLRVEPASFSAPPTPAAPVISQTPRPPVPGDPAAPEPASEVWKMEPGGALAKTVPVRRYDDLPTNTCFTAAELARMFDADDPELSSPDPFRRAAALDWRDRFAEAWALLREEEAKPDADPALLLLAANYRLYGRPGVPELLDPERPGFYRASLRDDARATLRRIVALAAPSNAPPRTLYLAARARALLAPASFEEECSRDADVRALLGRAKASDDAGGDAVRHFFKDLANEALLRGGFADDPGFVPVAPAHRWLRPAFHGTVDAGSADAPAPYAYEPFRPSDGAPTEWPFLCGRRDSVLARRGADGMADIAGRFLGRDELARKRGHATLSVDPAWGEWWARRAAIRGNAGARAAFEGDRLARPEAMPEPSAGNAAWWRDGGWHERSRFPGAPGMGAGGAIEAYETSPDLAEKCAPFGLRAFWFRRDLPPAGTAIGDDIRKLNARAAGAATNENLHANNALPDRLPFLLFLPPPAACTGAVPLVVYLPGNGEQGTDLAKQFRQTACIGKVCSAAFQAAHPAALLVPMPPDWGNHNISDGWPRDPFGPQAELFSDLVLAVARSSQALGGPAIDPARIHLTGLGSGAAIGAGMAFDHPGRFASVSGAWFFPYCEPNGRIPGAWWIAQEDKGLDEDEALAWKETFERRFKPFFDKVSALGGAAEYREYPPLPGAWWWDRMWRDDDAFWAWMLSRRSDGEIDPSDPASEPRFLFRHAEGGSHAESAEGAEFDSHAESAKTAEAESGEAEPPPVAAGEALVAAIATDGTACFFGAEADGAFAPPGFPVAVRFRPGEAGKTALARAKMLVVAKNVRTVPEGALAGLPSLECVFLRNAESISRRAFADCPALANVVVIPGPNGISIDAGAFARADGSRPVAWTATDRGDAPDSPERADGPFSHVFGVAARTKAPQHADWYADWTEAATGPRFAGVRVTDGCIWQRRGDGTARLLATVDPAAPPPAEIGGARVRADWERTVPEGRGERSEGGFAWFVSDGGAKLQRCTLTNDVVVLPPALGGAPLTGVADHALRTTVARGVRFPCGVKGFSAKIDDAWPETAPRAFWFDRPDASVSLWGEGASAAYAPFGAADWRQSGCRRLPASTDVEWLLARGADGPPRDAGFQFVKLAGADEAATVAAEDPPEAGVLAIPARLGGLPVAEIAEGTFPRRAPPPRWRKPADGDAAERSLAVVVPEGVRRIGPAAFADFGPLGAVALPASLEEIGPDAFAGCERLEEVDLPPGVRAIPAGAFANCAALRRVRAPGVASIGPFAFAGCPALETVEATDGCAVDADAFADSPNAAVRAPAQRAAPEPAVPAPDLSDEDLASLVRDAAAGAWSLPERGAAAFGHPATAELSVEDESGAPLPGAWVEWRFPAPGKGCVRSFEGLSRADANGALRVRGMSHGAFEACLVDPATRRRRPAIRLSESARGGFSGTLRRRAGEPEEEPGVDPPLLVPRGVPIGYDAAMRDFLPPFGTGERADATLTVRLFQPEDSGLGLECLDVEAAGRSESFLRQLPPWSRGRRRRVGHLLPPPCAWSATNAGDLASAALPWRAADDDSALRVALPPRREGGEPGWLEIRPLGNGDRAQIRIGSFLPEETPPALFPAARPRPDDGVPYPDGPFVAVANTSDGAALFLGAPAAPRDVAPLWTSLFRSVAAFHPVDGSAVTEARRGVDTLVLMDGVSSGPVPAGAFAGWTDLRCVVALGGAPRIEKGAFAGCTNLASLLLLGGAEPDLEDGAFEGCAPGFAILRAADAGLAEPVGRVWSWNRAGRLVWDGPRVLDGFVWSARDRTLDFWNDDPVDSFRGAQRTGVLRPLRGATNAWMRVPERVAGRAFSVFNAESLSDAVETIELPPGLVAAWFRRHVPDVVRSRDYVTDFAFRADPRLLFFPPGDYPSYPFGVDVGRTRILPPGADLAAQLAVKWQNRDCGGWLWIPVGDDAAQLVAWRGADPTNGVLALPAFVGPEDRRPDVPDAAAPPPGARRVVAVSPYMFRRHDASTQRERGAKFELVVPEGVETIGAFAFENTLRIERVRLPSTLRSLGEGAFSNCGNLKEVVLPEGVKEIPAGCFLGCAALERVSAPGATNVAALAFAGCERLADLSLAPAASLHPSALLDTPGIPSESEPHAESAENAEP